jgi:hypothetical protein
MRLWEDGFDHYGDSTKMLDGSYAHAGVSVSSSQFVTGTHSMYLSGFDGSSATTGLRKVLPTSKDTLGAAGRFYFNGLPSTNYCCAIFDFFTSSPQRSQVTCFFDANGSLRFVRGVDYSFNAAIINDTNYTPIAVTDPILTANAFNHIEVQIHIHDTEGWIRVAVNGVHRFLATELDTKYDSSNIVSVAQHNAFYGNANTTSNRDFYMDDYYIYDFEGDSGVDTDFCPIVDGNGIATNYIGELQVWPLWANADTAEADWLKSEGSDGYALIDENNPDDTDYIYSDAVDDLSEFELTDLPVEITYIRGLGIHSRLSKSDSGAAMVKVGMKSDAATEDSADTTITTIPTYWRHTFDVDPDSSARWTRASLNAAWLRLIRSV